jgi:hypothetical protein
MNMNKPPVEPNFPGICPVKSVKDFHKGAFPRPIFPQESLDFPAVKIQVHPIIRLDRPEILADSSKGKKG